MLVHDWLGRQRGRRSRSVQRSRPRVLRNEDLRGWWPVAQRAVWPKRIVEAAPAFHDDTGLRERVEDLAIE